MGNLIWLFGTVFAIAAQLQEGAALNFCMLSEKA